MLRNALGEEEAEVETDREIEIMMIRISEEGIEIEIFLEIEVEVEEEKERVIKIKIEKEIGNKIGDEREVEKIIEEGEIKEKAQRGREESQSLSQVVVQAALLPLIVVAAVQALSQVVLKLMAKMLNERDYLIT